MIGEVGEDADDEDIVGDEDTDGNDASASYDSTSKHVKTVLAEGLFDVFEMSKE